MRRLIICIAAVLTALTALTFALATGSAEDGVDLPILMYHHICADKDYLGDYVVSPETFEGDLRWLSEHGYESVTGAQLSAWCAGETALPDKPVMITFDDGQESFLSYALPLLEKYDMCAVLAVVGSYADAYTAREDHHLQYSYLSWPAVAECAASGRVEIAGHSQALHSLTGGRRGCRINAAEPADEYRRMLTADTETLEAGLALYGIARPVTYAYPFGLGCPEAQEVLTQRGYTVLLTCEQRVNRLSGDSSELLYLGRYNRANSFEREYTFGVMGMA